jgi:GGDEF domain-containing protein
VVAAAPDGRIVLVNVLAEELFGYSPGAAAWAMWCVDEQSAMALAHRLERAIERPVQIGNVEHRLTASIGIAVGHTGREELVRRADAALYGAKARGSGAIEVSA